MAKFWAKDSLGASSQGIRRFRIALESKVPHDRRPIITEAVAIDTTRLLCEILSKFKA